MIKREKIRIAVPKNIQWVEWIGSAVKGMGTVWGLEEQRRFFLELAVVEAVTNSITHATEDIELTFSQTEKGVRIEIWDDGPTVEDGLLSRFEKLPSPDPQNLESIAESGRGVFLIQETMEEVEFFRAADRNCLSFLCRTQP